MRFAAVLAGLLACTMIFLTNSPKVSAEAENNADKLTSIDVLTLLDKSSLAEELAVKDKKESDDKTVKYTVSEGDTLVNIASSYDTEWTRIFDKNENISDPNVLNPGITILIPDEEEKLPNRTDELKIEAPAPAQANATEDSYQPPAISRRPSVGNGYSYGYCTWYAKQKRPDLPNQMGNAISWVSSARAMGIPTGPEPRAGAIGQSGNHVVYVEKINGNGTITVSDMNYAGWGVVTIRKVPAHSYYYIY